MARKARRKTRTYRPRTYASRGGGGGRRRGWSLDGIPAGFVAGLIPPLVNKVVNLGGWTQPLTDIGVGAVMRNETLQTVGGRTIGSMLASGAAGLIAGGNGNGGNGWY